jgi:hypothetical protein
MCRATDCGFKGTVKNYIIKMKQRKVLELLYLQSGDRCLECRLSLLYPTTTICHFEATALPCAPTVVWVAQHNMINELSRNANRELPDIIMTLNVGCLGRAMAQAVSRRPLTAEARVRSRVSPCGVCGGQSGTGTVFSPSCRFSPVNFIPLVLH